MSLLNSGCKGVSLIETHYYNKIMSRSLTDMLSEGSLGTSFAMGISQLLPNQIGYFVADQISSLLSRRLSSPLVKAVMSNQWVIHEGNLSRKELLHKVRMVYHYQSRSLFETFRYMDRPDRLGGLVTFSPKLEEVLKTQRSSSRGLMLVLPHLCGFDLGGFALARRFKFLTLSYPNPPSGYQLQNEIRRKHGMDVLALSFSALRTARELLEKGGTVLTGLDRPNPESGYAPRFFGRAAALPVAHIRMALKTNAAVRVIAMVEGLKKSYVIDVSDEIPLEPRADAHQEIIENAERVLKEAEKFIMINPDRWVMFYPVWPEVEKQIPYLNQGAFQ